MLSVKQTLKFYELKSVTILLNYHEFEFRSLSSMPILIWIPWVIILEFEVVQIKYFELKTIRVITVWIKIPQNWL